MPVIHRADLRYTEQPGRRSANPLLEDGPDPCSIRVVRVPPGPRTPHRHPFSREVVYVAEGRGRVWEGDVADAVVPGDVVVIPTGVPHATVCTGSAELVLVCFFPHPDLTRNLEELPGPVRQ